MKQFDIVVTAFVATFIGSTKATEFTNGIDVTNITPNTMTVSTLKAGITDITIINGTTNATYSLHPPTSGPFNLIIISGDKTFDGRNLIPCHWGILMNGLCAYTATDTSEQNSFFTSPGQRKDSFNLNWELVGAEETYTLSMYMPGYIKQEGLSLPIFTTESHGGGEAPIDVYFDKHELLYRPGQYTGENERGEACRKRDIACHFEHEYKWFMCETNVNGYRYKTLAWSDDRPQNPTCVKVGILRQPVGRI